METLQKLKKENRKLKNLWRSLIVLDNKNWTGKNWNSYSKKWDSIKRQAESIIEKS